MEAKMYQRDLWEKAAECIRAIDTASDPEQRKMLTALRDIWIDLANESLGPSEMHVAKLAARMAQLQANLTQRPDRGVGKSGAAPNDQAIGAAGPNANRHFRFFGDCF
jgi:hypothetical protein